MCYSNVRAFNDTIHFVHFFRKSQSEKKRQSVGRIWDPDRYKCRKWALSIRILQQFGGNVPSRKGCYQKVNGSEEIAVLEKSISAFLEKKISTLRNPERNFCLIQLWIGSKEPHWRQYFYTIMERNLKHRGSRDIRLSIFSRQNFFFFDLINKCQCVIRKSLCLYV